MCPFHAEALQVFIEDERRHGRETGWYVTVLGGGSYFTPSFRGDDVQAGSEVYAGAEMRLHDPGRGPRRAREGVLRKVHPGRGASDR